MFEDAAFSTPTRALKADRYLFTRQTFAEFPDLRVSGPSFTDAKKISDANPQQAEYLWGKRVLFDYKNKDGVRLQGILATAGRLQAGREAADDRDASTRRTRRTCTATRRRRSSPAWAVRRWKR